MRKPISGSPGIVSRRDFIRAAAILAGTASLSPWSGRGEDFVDLPFENGRRPLAQYPQKRPLICLTRRPPQLETPFAVFDGTVLTPNDAFFVRYHLAQFYPEAVDPSSYRCEVAGSVQTPLSLSLEDLRTKFEVVETVAVAQCSGNSRGFFTPRVGGGQLGNGAMGNARWKGVRLRDILQKAGVSADGKQVVFDGLDKPVLEKTPDFVKALDLAHVMDGEVLVAWEMNGEPLPILNGYPLRLIVPGYYATYWVKHLSSIKVVNEPFNGFWMSTGYRIPDNSCGCVPPGTTPAKTVPINRMNVRSFITSPGDKLEFHRDQDVLLRGIAFDGGYGISEVGVTVDDGVTWQSAQLGENLGKYSFRPWTMALKFPRAGTYKVMARAVNRTGQTQPMEALWNPAGYMRNVVEAVSVRIV